MENTTLGVEWNLHMINVKRREWYFVKDKITGNAQGHRMVSENFIRPSEYESYRIF